jgi:CBS domain-containing protein
MAAAGPTDAYLSARDPVDEGDPIDPKDKDTLFIGLLRLHIANLIKPLGHAELSGALHRLTHQPFARRLQDDLNHARTLLDAAPVRELEKASSTGGLIGGIVTRGPVVDADVSPAVQEALARLHLRPIFVGIERDLIRAAIDAEPQAVRSRIADTVSPDEFARPDRAGGWIIPLGEERRIIGST